METVEKITPDPVYADVANERLRLMPIKVRELPKAFKAVKPVLADVMKLFKTMPSGDDAESVRYLTQFVMEGSDDLVEAIVALAAILSRKDREWVDNLDLDELVHLIGKLIVVNGDFLAQKILPAFTTAVNEVTDVLFGQEPSTPSSEPATD